MIDPEHQTPIYFCSRKTKGKGPSEYVITPAGFSRQWGSVYPARCPSKECAPIPAWEILAALYGTALSSEQQKEISGGDKAKVAGALVLLMCVGDKRKEAGLSEARLQRVED